MSYCRTQREINKNRQYERDRRNIERDCQTRTSDMQPMQPRVTNGLPDLDFNNYSTEELYGLFKLKPYTPLTDDIMKNVRRVVLMTHPDKSSLSPEYFIFFRKALAVMEEIYKFTTNKRDSNRSTTYTTTDLDTDIGETELNKIIRPMMQREATETKQIVGFGNQVFKNESDFNRTFNEAWEKSQIDFLKTGGYEDWFRKGETKDYGKVPMSNMNDFFRERKKETRELIVRNDDGLLHGWNSGDTIGMGSNIVGENESDYTSGMFSGNFGYTDLQRAHETETVIPVSEDDLANVPQFKTVDEYVNHRTAHNPQILSKQHYEELLNKNYEQTNMEATARAHKLIEEQTRHINAKQMFNQHFLRISN